jgi:hypothetical protein
VRREAEMEPQRREHNRLPRRERAGLVRDGLGEERRHLARAAVRVELGDEVRLACWVGR